MLKALPVVSPLKNRYSINDTENAKMAEALCKLPLSAPPPTSTKKPHSVADKEVIEIEAKYALTLVLLPNAGDSSR